MIFTLRKGYRSPEDIMVCTEVVSIRGVILCGLSCCIVKFPVSKQACVNVRRVKLVEMVRSIDLFCCKDLVPKTCLCNHSVKAALVII